MIRSIRIAAACAIAFATSASFHAAQAAPPAVQIILANFSYTPAALKLSAGQPVTLHFVNQGSGGHDFTAEKFFAAARMEDATRKILGKGKVALEKGESRDVTLTPAAGHYEVHCTHFLHSSLGMTGTIDVQ